MLNLFYAEPEPDRWLPLDRYPRRAVRRVVRGKRQPGGQERVFLNLRAGLDRLGVAYRVNDFGHARSHPNELACIIGKPHLLDKLEWKNPILFGAAVFSHPTDDPHLLERRRIKAILVPGAWMARMCEPYWGTMVRAWPVGIDTDVWKPNSEIKDIDVLLYDKVRWRHEEFERSMIEPIRERLARDGRSVLEIRYGHYREATFHAALQRCRTMIFLCEHETQGIAYQQALAAGVPIFAWDRQGPWQDPVYFPDKVVFGPVSSVPYWDERCGLTFADEASFEAGWSEFWASAQADNFQPRDFILENLTLERCAAAYLHIVDEIR